MRIVVYLLFLAGCCAEKRLSESNGPFHLMLSTLRKCFYGQNLDIQPEAIRINFNDYANGYTASYPINDAADGILKYKDLDKTNKFVIFVPGFTSRITMKTRQMIKESFKDPGTYMIVLNDRVYTNALPNLLTAYQRSVLYTYHIGKALAEMLITLMENGVSPKNMHLIGHSLGAHISGNTGNIFYEKTGQKIARITGLDPAGPCFYDSKYHLKSGSADFVDAYHCNAYQLGTDKNIADVNFYVNDGVSQPKCGAPPIPDITLSSMASLCSHMACQNFFFLTVSQPNLFPAYKCDSYKNFQNGGCRSDKTVAGYSTPDDVRGVYYTSTGGQAIN
ncbi:phospholipase A1-like [Aricia agestis]|uniref:phospholipase A1-like n=1 Tax=Aricia agestis TaxID=91739 RepID=UPI001C208033|nr:phospholipase A1-like [Aricia agestis]